MLLVPDDRLAEVQPVLLQERRIVAEVGVAAPDVEPAARHQHAGDVAEPGIQQPVELFVGDEVVRQRPVLGPHLLAGRLGLLRMAGQVEALVMRGVLRLPSEPRTNSAPRAIALLLRGSTFTLYGGSVLHQWIGWPSSRRSRSSGRRLSPHSRRWSPRIHRSPGWVVASSGGSGTSSGSVSPSVTSGLSSLASSSASKPSRSRSNSSPCSSASSSGSRSKSHVGDVAGLVVGDAVRLDLRRRQVLGHMDGHFGQAQLLGRLPAGVADDDHVLLVDHDRLAEAELLQGRGHRGDGARR